MKIKKTSQNLPYLGFGIGLRPPHYRDLLEAKEPVVDWLEIISENFMLEGGQSQYYLDQFNEKYQLIPHGVSLSIGSVDPLDFDYLSRLKKLTQKIKAPWFSDHLCWSQYKGKHMHNLLPLPYTEEVVEFVAKKIKIVQEELEIPFILENVSSYAEFAASEMNEATFLSQICEKADCGILLDINNIYVSSRNHDFDPLSYLKAIPRERVVQFHVAGHEDNGHWVLDSHDHPVRDEVWTLYEEAIPLFGPVSTLLERDDHIPNLTSLLQELDTAKKIYHKVSHEKEPITV